MNAADQMAEDAARLAEAEKQQRANVDGDHIAETLVCLLMKIGTKAIETMGEAGTIPHDPRVHLARQLSLERKIHPWNFMRVVAELTKDDDSDVVQALHAATKLESMLTKTDRHEVWSENPDDALASAAMLGLWVGLAANQAFGTTQADLIAGARSQLARDLQLIGAAKRADWTGPARDYLAPKLASKPWLSHNKAAIELEAADPAIYAAVKYRPPDRIQVAKWVRAERNKKPPGLPPQKKKS